MQLNSTEIQNFNFPAVNNVNSNTVYPENSIIVQTPILPPIYLPMQNDSSVMLNNLAFSQLVNMNMMQYSMIGSMVSGSNLLFDGVLTNPSPSPSNEDFLSIPSEMVAFSRSVSPCNSLPDKETKFSSTNSRGRKPRKFPHRSKQQKIEEIHEEVVRHYTEMGIFAGPEEVLRGEDTVRVHVKTFKGLTIIQKALRDVHNHMEVDILRIAAPISMKNRFQKKGFIVYLKLGKVSQTPIVQHIFEVTYGEHFKKCDIALPKPEELPVLKSEDTSALIRSAFTKQSSIGA